MERIDFNGWNDAVKLSNQDVEVVITTQVGPRVARVAFKGERNCFAEMQGQQGGCGESEWMIRGGHRFWIAPELKPRTYELDNEPVKVDLVDDGIRTIQNPGPLSGCVKQMDVRLSQHDNRIEVCHTLTNASDTTVNVAPWALSVMAPGGMAILPMPAYIAHTERVLHNQEWSLWGYTDLSDTRWTLGQRYLFFRHDAAKGPNKLGIAHREGWVAYLLDGFLFVKHFDFDEKASYPDGGVNCEVFANQDFLEVESLGGLVDLPPGDSVEHRESWSLFRDVPSVSTEDEADRFVRSLIELA